MVAILVAHGAILSLAVASVYVGSRRSVDMVVRAVASRRPTLTSRVAASPLEKEVFSSSEAYMFPLTGSATLLTLYLLLRYVGKEYVNRLISAYVLCLGLYALATSLASLAAPLEDRLRESGYRLPRFELLLNRLPLALQSAAAKKKHAADSKVSDTAAASSDDASASQQSLPLRLATLTFSYLVLAAYAVSLACTLLYAITKFWVLNNVFGVAFSVTSIPFLNIDSFRTSFILLAGLFFYDIFWVFGTNVMVSVAVNIDAPIKLVFPRNIFDPNARLTMLGLGDIVVPGVVIALCLRWDYHRYLLACLGRSASGAPLTRGRANSASASSATSKSKAPVAVSSSSSIRSRSAEKTAAGNKQKKEKNTVSATAAAPTPTLTPLVIPESIYSAKYPRPYFIVAIVAYTFGLVLTIVVMHVFNAAQPALLYLSPLGIIAPCLTALVRGELAAMFKYSADSDNDLKNEIAPDDTIPEAESACEKSSDASEIETETKNVASASTLPMKKNIQQDKKYDDISESSSDFDNEKSNDNECDEEHKDHEYAPKKVATKSYPSHADKNKDESHKDVVKGKKHEKQEIEKYKQSPPALGAKEKISKDQKQPAGVKETAPVAAISSKKPQEQVQQQKQKEKSPDTHNKQQQQQQQQSKKQTLASVDHRDLSMNDEDDGDITRHNLDFAPAAFGKQATKAKADTVAKKSASATIVNKKKHTDLDMPSLEHTPLIASIPSPIASSELEDDGAGFTRVRKNSRKSQRSVNNQNLKGQLQSFTKPDMAINEGALRSIDAENLYTKNDAKKAQLGSQKQQAKYDSLAFGVNDSDFSASSRVYDSSKNESFTGYKNFESASSENRTDAIRSRSSSANNKKAAGVLPAAASPLKTSNGLPSLPSNSFFAQLMASKDEDWDSYGAPIVDAQFYTSKVAASAASANTANDNKNNIRLANTPQQQQK